MADLFSGDSWPLDNQIACVERELRIREGFYPGQVAAGKMTQRFADDQISLMKDVLISLKRLRGVVP